MGCCMSATGSFDITAHPALDAQKGVIDKQWTEMNKRIATIERKMCLWAAPTYGDAGEDWQKNFWKAAMIAVATINTLAQIKIAKKQYQIAKDYANIATDRWKRFRDDYAPLERAMLNEACTTPVPVPDYAGAKQRGNTIARGDFQSAQSRVSELADSYALCVDPSLLDNLSLMGTVAADDGVNWGYRDEENLALNLDDRRWNRRSTLLNLGRDIHSISSTYASSANQIMAGLGDLLNQGAGGAMSILGYLSENRNTAYPSLFSGMSPFSGQSSAMGEGIYFGPDGM